MSKIEFKKNNEYLNKFYSNLNKLGISYEDIIRGKWIYAGGNGVIGKTSDNEYVIDKKNRHYKYFLLK